MRISFKKSEADFMLESLKFTKLKFEGYPIGPPGGYPNHEFKLERIREVDDLICKIRKAKRGE